MQTLDEKRTNCVGQNRYCKQIKESPNLKKYYKNNEIGKSFTEHSIINSISDQIKFTRELSQFGMSSTFSCDPGILDHIRHHYLQGVIYMTHKHDDMLMFKKMKPIHFMMKYKWLIVGDHVPDALRKIRYDSDVAFLECNSVMNNGTRDIAATPVHIYDAYVHPRDGISINFWAHWTNASGLVLTHERERILRRLDLKRYPLKIATPVGHYSSDKYDGTFVDFLEDESISDQDPGIRSGYGTSMLLTEVVNAQDVLIENELWAAMINNNSMYVMLSMGEADLSGGILRILWDRTFTLDYVMPIWPFRVGFTYLAERESSSNMYLEPFSPAVWWSCLAMMAILALVERVTSKTPREKDGAFYTVLTTWLQQDASAVPEGASGRWAFTVLSVSAMLVHAYYTSAIVSALMSTGRGGPDSLKALGDSKYAIASEDYDYMRYLFFDVETTWDDLEYLKKKKMTSKFYQELERGVELIQQGSTAFHSEYNQIYPHFKTFSDEHICKLQHVDTIPETLTWITSTKDGQWTEVLRTAGGWLLETGLGKRLVARLRIPQPPCRASLLAERVKLGDIAPLLVLTVFGALLSVVLLGVEILVAKAKKARLPEGDAKVSLENVDDIPDIVEHSNYIE
ncbi:ionotropic receptor 75a-like [Spodoptera frugiperda]|uniref:Ionotropic receptor 75a-like n=1 Tax=Spodoptera frugiperda TaxID=7108 RepID=A0A9R0DUH6_SPOFR|nr:ionotropic receptor 75a-like [Spodoptera frugiperda]